MELLLGTEGDWRATCILKTNGKMNNRLNGLFPVLCKCKATNAGMGLRDLRKNEAQLTNKSLKFQITAEG